VPTPQQYRIKLRRGLAYTWVGPADSEVHDPSGALLFGSLKDARIEKDAWLDDPAIGAAEVEIVTP
jgi:hypothetical protein